MKLNPTVLVIVFGCATILHSFGNEPQSKADTAPREDREEILIEAAVIEVTLSGTSSAETSDESLWGDDIE